MCSAEVHCCVRGGQWNHTHAGIMWVEKGTGNALSFLINLCWWAFEQRTKPHFHYQLILNTCCQRIKLPEFNVMSSDIYRYSVYSDTKGAKASHLWSWNHNGWHCFLLNNFHDYILTDNHSRGLFASVLSGNSSLRRLFTRRWLTPPETWKQQELTTVFSGAIPLTGGVSLSEILP